MRVTVKDDTLSARCKVTEIDDLIGRLRTVRDEHRAQAWQQRDYSLRQMVVFTLRQLERPLTVQEVSEGIQATFGLRAKSRSYSVLVRDESRARKLGRRRDYIVRLADGRLALSTWDDLEEEHELSSDTKPAGV